MTLRLITIPISHFCEKARWALDRSKLAYREEAHLQALHYVATKAVGGGITVPVLVHPGGVLSDSKDIVRWVDQQAELGLYPSDQRGDVEQLETELGRVLGVVSRLWVYDALLGERDLALQYNRNGLPSWQRAIFPALYPLAVVFLRRRLAISDDAVASARRRVSQVFDDIAARLSDGRPFLMGDSFTAADLTFAALSAPVLLPRAYGVPLPLLREVPRDFRLHVEALREHPAGQFALRMYAEER